MATGLLDFQRMLKAKDPDVSFPAEFGDRIPVRGLQAAGLLKPGELQERTEVVSDGFARVLDSWNPADMDVLSRVVDMHAKGVYRILVHQPYFAPQQSVEKPPRLCVYLVWHELHREFRQASTAPPPASPRPDTGAAAGPPTDYHLPFPEPSDAHIRVPPV